jgi:hypothetical protein
MRLSRFLLLPIATLALAACSEDDGVTVNARPPLGGVRFINAVPDAGPLDIRMVDQLQWSASSVTTTTGIGLPFRAGTIHWPTEAKARRIRVFPNDSLLAVTTTVLHDTTITVEANKNVTLMLVGTLAAGDLRFVTLDDVPPTLTGQQVAVRLVNASSTGQTPAAANGHLLATATTALAATPTWSNVAPRATAAYVVRDTGTFAVRTTATGTTTPIWTATAPAGEPQNGLIGATAGFRAGGSAMSAYLFPRACPAVATPITAANCQAARGQSAASRWAGSA